MRTCTSCLKSKPETEYYATGKGGIAGSCKECAKARARANYRRNRERYREYERKRASLPHRVEAREQYAQTPNGMARASAAKRRYSERNPIKRRAHSATWHALNDGRLTPKPCEVCGAEKAQAHHDDYSKPLDVRWLCTTHHAEWHEHNTPLCPEQEQAA
jgi:hypothetical protein